MRPEVKARGRLIAFCAVAAAAVTGLLAAQPAARFSPLSDEFAVAVAKRSQHSDRVEQMGKLLEHIQASIEQGAVPVSETLHAAWAAYILAENDAERARVLAVAARVPDARARMLIGSFREFPGLRKDYALADRAHSELIAKPGDATEKKRPPRDVYGPNPFDAPFTADGWSDPFGYAGRWQNEKLSVDIIAYPAGNFLAITRLPTAEAPRRMLGLLKETSLLLVGPGLEGTLAQGTLALRLDGQAHILKRVPVGVVAFAKRPAGARVLLDATTGLKNFRHAKAEAGWTLLPGGVIEIEPSKGSLFTKDSFGDLRGYLEFRHAYNSESLGPRRGNSGLYLHNAYEVQLVDGFGLPPDETSAGSVYHIAAPKVTASAPPLEWQSIEFEFRAPRFDAEGKKNANARLTLWMNGEKLHDDIEIPNPTAGSAAGGRALKDPTGRQPLMLQSHGNILQFRHIWVQPLAD